MYKWALYPAPKLHIILIVGTMAPKSKHKSNPIANQTQIHKYIQTYDTNNKHKTKQHQQIFTKQNTPLINTHKTKYKNQTGVIIAILAQQILKFTSNLITHRQSQS